jgi:hypothetical protein
MNTHSKDPPHFPLEHTAHMTLADVAKMTTSDTQDTHHRLWQGKKTPASRAWVAEVDRFSATVYAKAARHEIPREEAARQVSQMIATHSQARYIHGLFTYHHFLGWREKFMADLAAKPRPTRTESRLLADWAKLKALKGAA